MSRYYFTWTAGTCRRWPGRSSPTARREYLEAVVIGPGVIVRRDGDDLLPVITLRSDGTEIRHQPSK
jgi:hypothetical protein